MKAAERLADGRTDGRTHEGKVDSLRFRKRHRHKDRRGEDDEGEGRRRRGRTLARSPPSLLSLLSSTERGAYAAPASSRATKE